MTKRAILFLSAILSLLAGIRCGEEGPTKKSETFRDGRIFFRNDTATGRVETEYFNEDTGEIIKAEIPIESIVDISKVVLEGGTEVLVDFCVIQIGADWRGCVKEVKVKINGDQTIRLMSFSQGNIAYEVME